MGQRWRVIQSATAVLSANTSQQISIFRLICHSRGNSRTIEFSMTKRTLYVCLRCECGLIPLERKYLGILDLTVIQFIYYR